MISGGDELSRTQAGNNNAYGQDNELSWYHWDLSPEKRNSSTLHGASASTANTTRIFTGTLLRSRSGCQAPEKNIVWFRADGKRMQDKDWQNGGWMRTLGMFMNGTASEIRDDHGQCAEDTDFLLLLNAHHEPCHFGFRLSSSMADGKWHLTQRAHIDVDTEPVGRNRLVKLAARSLVLLSHER